jgi:4-amino-4-deoxy-L-arabinose transferase-like glycosyltransferase
MNIPAKQTNYGISTSLSGLRIRIVQSIALHEGLFLLLILAVFGLRAAYFAITTPLSFDEIFTLFISRLASVSEMWKAMPADGQPPLQYFLTHVTLRFFGETELGVRLPELLGYLTAGFLTYKIIRRHSPIIQAAFALALFLGASLNSVTATTARPYGLLLAFTALVFASWQVAESGQQDRLLPLCGVAFGIAGATLSHQFGLIHVSIFLAAGETVRFIQRRRLDGPMLAAIAVGISPLSITLPLARQSRLILGEAILHSTTYWAKPSFVHLLAYIGMVALPLPCLVALWGFWSLPEHSSRDSKDRLPPVPACEWAAAVALCFLLPTVLVFSALETGYFLPKYAVSTTVGLAVVIGWALPRLDRLRINDPFVLALSSVCYLLIIAANLSVAQIRYPAWKSIPGRQALSPLLLNAPAGFAIVVANPFDYAPQWWYSPQSLKPRLTYLSDIPYAVRQSDFLPELSLAANQRFIPLRVTDYAVFLSSHSHFLLLRTGEPRLNWVESRLENAGWRLSLVASSSPDALYRVDRP